MKKIYLTMEEDVIERFDGACRKHSLTRGQYLEKLLSVKREIRPPALQYRMLIKNMESIERELKVIALKEDLSENDQVLVMARIDDLKELLKNFLQI